MRHGLTAAVMSSWEAHLFHGTRDCFPLRKGRSLCSQSTERRASALFPADTAGEGEIPPCNPAGHPPAIQGWSISRSHPPHHLTAQSTRCKSSCFAEKGSPPYTWSFVCLVLSDANESSHLLPGHPESGARAWVSSMYGTHPPPLTGQEGEHCWGGVGSP